MINENDTKHEDLQAQLALAGRVEPVVICAVITQLDNGNVDTRVFDSSGLAIIGKDGAGEDYHLGQISSSKSWAENDIVIHFKDEYNQLFPAGWAIQFEYR